MYDKTVRRRRAALLIFVALSIGLLTVYFGESAGGGLHAIQRGAQEVLAPIEEGASRAFKPFRDAVNWAGDVFDAKSENKELKDEVARLREDLGRFQYDNSTIKVDWALSAPIPWTSPQAREAGTIHLAVGQSYPETGGVNESAVHWDMVCDLRKGGRITVDGDVFMEDGKFRV